MHIRMAKNNKKKVTMLLELLYLADGDEKWHSHCGKYFGSF